jgi:hypothetical protein
LVQGGLAKDETKRRDAKVAEGDAEIHAGKSMNSESAVTPKIFVKVNHRLLRFHRNSKSSHQA